MQILNARYYIFSFCTPSQASFHFPFISNISTVDIFIMPREKLTHLIFTLLIFDPLEDVVDDATSSGIVEKSVFVVDDETAVK